MIIIPWSLRLLGAFRVQQRHQESIRFETQKTAELLAYLAYFSHRNHPRDELMEALWHNVDPTAGRNRLKQALSTLRRQLEPPGIPSGSILVANRTHIRLNELVIETDVKEFKTALQAAVRLKSDREKIEALVGVVDLFEGELLPGVHSDWVVQERQILNDALFKSLSQLRGMLEQQGDLEHAIIYAKRLLRFDNFLEESHQTLIRLYLAAGRSSAALQQYRTLESILAQEFGIKPSERTIALMASLKTRTLPPLPKQKRSTGTCREASSPHIAYQATDASFHLRADLMSPDPLPTSHLPVPLTRFIGRQEEISSLLTMLTMQPTAALLEAPEPADQVAGPCRLITLEGPGGCGKTRLALAVAEKLQAFYPDSIWFVGLEDVADPDQMLEVLIDALHQPRFTPLAPLDQIVAALSRRPSLLILDSCERLEEAADLILMLLGQVPTLTCLITSCRRLHLEGERAFSVAPLPTPKQEQNIEQLMQCDSVRLFIDRAQMVQSDFRITLENASIIAELCIKLEGLPLALELAAGWTRTLGTAQILARLARRFDLLVSRDKGIINRRSSLRASIDSSYALLSPAQQRLWMRLSIFRGGWSLEAAECVFQEPDMLEQMEHLRDHCLAIAEERDGHIRFHMLESLREYVAEKATPAEHNQLAHDHANYFRRFAEEACLHLQGAEQEIWLEKLERERDNLRAALEWLVDQPDGIEAGLRLAGALWRFWWMRGLLEEGERWLRSTLSRRESSPGPARARALLGAACIAHFQGDYERARACNEECIRLYRASTLQAELSDALAFLSINPALQQENLSLSNAALQESLELSRRVGRLNGQAFALGQQGRMAWFEGDVERAMELLEQTLELYQVLCDRRGIASTLNEIGGLALCRGEYAYARRRLEENLTTSRKTKDHSAVSSALWRLGEIACCCGNYEEAVDLLEESLEMRRSSGEKAGIAEVLSTMGMVVTCQGNYERSRALQEESMTFQRQLSKKPDIALTMDRLARIALLQGDYTRARRLYQESLTIFRASRFQFGIAGSLYGLGILKCRTGHYEVARSLLVESLALRQSLNDRKGMIDCLEGLTRIYQARRQYPQAATLLGASTALRSALGAPLPPLDLQELDRCIRAVKTSLDQEIFASYWIAGTEMTLDEALTYVLEQ